ncbi:Hypothetical protein NTJ_03304 [Nesidiocoris tenuis]|uniref:Secreted protein n=1 Tax=Nesidiocoris tenuis TaxID=355587 RepID=A0ABN7AHY6_9HEMI|nr:Hypothetical protein NTJ_03304 [Nesidiocoris tenuis]
MAQECATPVASRAAPVHPSCSCCYLFSLLFFVIVSSPSGRLSPDRDAPGDSTGAASGSGAGESRARTQKLRAGAGSISPGYTSAFEPPYCKSD